MYIGCPILFINKYPESHCTGDYEIRRDEIYSFTNSQFKVQKRSGLLIRNISIERLISLEDIMIKNAQKGIVNGKE